MEENIGTPSNVYDGRYSDMAELNPDPYEGTVHLTRKDGTTDHLTRSQFHKLSAKAIFSWAELIQKLVKQGNTVHANRMCNIFCSGVLESWTRVNVIGWDEYTIVPIDEAMAICAFLVEQLDQ